jgi:hypothetical protein
MDRATMPRTRLAEYLTSLIYDGLPGADALGPASNWLPEVGPDPNAGSDTGSAPDPIASTADTDSAPGVVTPLAINRRRNS